jgi:hypothetical protein
MTIGRQALDREGWGLTPLLLMLGGMVGGLAPVEGQAKRTVLPRMEPGSVVALPRPSWDRPTAELFEKVPEQKKSVVEMIVDHTEEALLRGLGSRFLVIRHRGLYERVEEIFRLRPADRTPTQRALAQLGKTPGNVCGALRYPYWPAEPELKAARDRKALPLFRQLFGIQYVVRGVLQCEPSPDRASATMVNPEKFRFKAVVVLVYDTASAKCIFEGRAEVNKAIGELKREGWKSLEAALRTALAPLRPRPDKR